MGWFSLFDDPDPELDWTSDLVIRYYALLAATRNIEKPDASMNDRRVTARRIEMWLTERHGDRETRLRALAAASMAQLPGERVRVEDLLYDAKTAEKYLTRG